MKKKIYVCDGCQKQIDNPYSAEMKEFYISYSYENKMLRPFNISRKKKIHLCKNCFGVISQLSKEQEEVV